MIAAEVAVSTKHEGHDHPISPALFKMRLICRTFAAAATFVFLKLVSREDHSQYKVLNFPPRSGRLDGLKTALCAKDKTMPNLITSMVFHVTTALEDSPQDDYLHDFFHDMIDEDCDGRGDLEYSCHCGELVEANYAFFAQQCVLQDNFATHLKTGNGASNLGSIMARLKNLQQVELKIEDFWSDLYTFGISTAETQVAGSTVFQNAIPVFLEQLSRSRASSLKFTGWGSHAWAGLHPLKLVELSRKKNFLSNITTFELNVTHRDNTDCPDGWDESLHYALGRGDRVCLLLSCMKNLASLTLEITDVNPRPGDETYGDKQWLRDVLSRQSWNGSRSFVLKDFKANEDSLKDFLMQHRGALREIRMEKIEISDADLLTCLNLMRTKLQLAQAYVDVEPTHVLATDLKDIIAKHGSDVPAEALHAARKNIGGYVTGRRPEVIDLEA